MCEGFIRNYYVSASIRTTSRDAERTFSFRFGLISSLIVFIYATSVQNVDPEEYGGIVEIIKEGFMTAFATFLVGL